MTLRRQWAHAVRVVALVVLTSGAAAALDTKPAHPTERGWLRDTAGKKPAVAKAAPVASPWRLGILGLVVAGLGGVAIFVKRRRRVSVRKVRSELEVLTSARVGSKAEVVVVSVGGKKLLVGVTDSHVNSLGWLDDELASDTLEEADSSPHIYARPEAVRLAPEQTGEPVRALAAAPAPKRFRDALFGALGKGNDERLDPAVAIAEETRDVVTRSSRTDDGPRPTLSRVAAPAGAPEMVDIEGQARGLVLRLQKRV